MKRCVTVLSILMALLLLVGSLPLTVFAATLKITTQPKTSYTAYGETAKATVKATGDGLKYTWYVKNAGSSKYSKSSVTKSTYSVKMTDSVKGRSVYCVVKDKKGKTVKSSAAVLRMKATVTTEPKTTYAKQGATAKLTVKAKGDGLKYAWYVKNAGASKYSKSSITKSTYSVTMTDKVHGRYVYCVVTDQYGKTDKSKTVVLRRQATITTQPKSTTVAQGAIAKVTVKAKGDGLKYAWYVKNAGATKYTKSSITKSTYSVTMTDKVNGRYVYCIVTDKYGKTERSKTVSLKQTAAPLTVTLQPENTAADAGDEAGFGIVVKGGTKPYTYRWEQYDSATGKWVKATGEVLTLGEQNMLSFTVTAETFGTQYRCVVTDANGNKITSEKAQVTRRSQPLAITKQPESAYASVGDEVGLAIVVKGGTQPYTYRWKYYGAGMTDWADAEGEILTVGDQNILLIQVTQEIFDRQCMYYCVVTDAEDNEVSSQVVRINQQ